MSRISSLRRHSKAKRAHLSGLAAVLTLVVGAATLAVAPSTAAEGDALDVSDLDDAPLVIPGIGGPAPATAIEVSPAGLPETETTPPALSGLADSGLFGNDSAPAATPLEAQDVSDDAKFFVSRMWSDVCENWTGAGTCDESDDRLNVTIEPAPGDLPLGEMNVFLDIVNVSEDRWGTFTQFQMVPNLAFDGTMEHLGGPDIDWRSCAFPHGYEFDLTVGPHNRYVYRGTVRHHARIPSMWSGMGDLGITEFYTYIWASVAGAENWTPDHAVLLPGEALRCAGVLNMGAETSATAHGWAEVFDRSLATPEEAGAQLRHEWTHTWTLNVIVPDEEISIRKWSDVCDTWEGDGTCEMDPETGYVTIDPAPGDQIPVMTVYSEVTNTSEGYWHEFHWGDFAGEGPQARWEFCEFPAIPGARLYLADETGSFHRGDMEIVWDATYTEQDEFEDGEVIVGLIARTTAGEHYVMAPGETMRCAGSLDLESASLHSNFAAAAGWRWDHYYGGVRTEVVADTWQVIIADEAPGLLSIEKWSPSHPDGYVTRWPGWYPDAVRVHMAATNVSDGWLDRVILADNTEEGPAVDWHWGTCGVRDIDGTQLWSVNLWEHSQHEHHPVYLNGVDALWDWLSVSPEMAAVYGFEFIFNLSSPFGTELVGPGQSVECDGWLHMGRADFFGPDQGYDFHRNTASVLTQSELDVWVVDTATWELEVIELDEAPLTVRKWSDVCDTWEGEGTCDVDPETGYVTIEPAAGDEIPQITVYMELANLAAGPVWDFKIADFTRAGPDVRWQTCTAPVYGQPHTFDMTAVTDKWDFEFIPFLTPGLDPGSGLWWMVAHDEYFNAGWMGSHFNPDFVDGNAVLRAFTSSGGEGFDSSLHSALPGGGTVSCVGLLDMGSETFHRNTALGWGDGRLDDDVDDNSFQMYTYHSWQITIERDAVPPPTLLLPPTGGAGWVWTIVVALGVATLLAAAAAVVEVRKIRAVPATRA
ncbi:MAG: hypothetical protein FWG11_03920 [Promicromonosporaceae bacterium]|nr:hypothetical protein [Promicromonosporaceae bacterium]